MKRWLVLLAVSLAACTKTVSVEPSHRYVGTATPSRPGPLCPTTKAEAQVRDGVMLLAPDDGTWTLQGSLAADGTVAADKTIQAASKQPWTTMFQGRWTPTDITGTYTTPRCTFSIALKSS